MQITGMQIIHLMANKVIKIKRFEIFSNLILNKAHGVSGNKLSNLI